MQELDMHANFIFRCFLSGIITCLGLTFAPAPSLQASTRAGEVVVTSSNPENADYRVAVLFNEYFSGPREFFPGMPTGGGEHFEITHQKAILLIDDVAVNKEAFLQAMLPGRRMYGYWKGETEFITMSTGRLPTQGSVTEQKGDSLVLRRFITRRYDTGTAVFREFACTLDANAEYFIDGEPATKAKFQSEASNKNVLVRVWPARKQRLSGFRSESLVEVATRKHDRPHEPHSAGVLLNDAPVTEKERVIQIKEAGGGVTEVEFGRKGYLIADGRYVPSRWSFAYQKGNRAIGYVKGGSSYKYLMIRTAGAGAVDGIVSSHQGDKLTLAPLGPEGSPTTFDVEKDALFLLDGVKSTASDVLKQDNRIVVYDARPQRVELWSKHPETRIEWLQSRPQNSKEERRQSLVICYDVKGRRTVLTDGFSPWFDDPRSTFHNPEKLNSVLDSRVPTSVHEAGEEAARKVTEPNGPFLYTIEEIPSTPYHDIHVQE